LTPLRYFDAVVGEHVLLLLPAAHENAQTPTTFAFA
jgi:hypothetical protein